MERLGIVDLGSNTARLVVYHHEPGRWYQVVDEVREPLRLGQGLGSDGALREEAIERAVALMQLFEAYARANCLDRIEVLGTSAVREARNRDELLSRLRALGLQVTVLSGEDEARLGLLAVANGFVVRDAWVMDLGGGSAQLSRMKGRRFAGGRAHPLGAVRLTDRFFTSRPPRASEVAALEAEVAMHAEPVAESLRAEGLPLIAMGGTVRNLVRAVQKAQEYPLRLAQGFFLRREALEDVTVRLLKNKGRVPGIHPDREDIIHAGALVYRWLVRRADLPGLWVSGHGMRHGAFYRHFLPEPHLVDDIRRFHVENLLHRHHPPSRTYGVRRLAAQLYDGLASLHGLGAAERELLDAGAAMRDIGKTVNHFRHYRHAAYMVAWADLSGFTHREQGLLALLTRYHREGSPKLREYGDLARPGDKKMLVVLTACLRLAQAISGLHGGAIRDVDVRVADDQVEVEVTADHQP
ncbi:MAG: exopolyphosphatase, partial [Myxococcota bacterium]